MLNYHEEKGFVLPDSYRDEGKYLKKKLKHFQ